MGKNLKVHLVVIDGQNDFMGNDDGTPYSVKLADGKSLTATLPVKGAVSDMKRFAAMVDRVGHKIEDIHTTLDSHHVVDVGHPGMFKDQDGNQPTPIMSLSSQDFINGIWTTRNPNDRQRMIDYDLALESSKNKYPHMVWPEHCIIGSWGHNFQIDLALALNKWARKYCANIDTVVKGTNPYTEHYGALMAEVPDPSDPSTQLNTAFLGVMQDADIIGFAGEALDYCVLTTLIQIVENIGKEHLKKFHLLTDCMSSVAPSPKVDQFLKDMSAEGMTLTTSTEFLR